MSQKEYQEVVETMSREFIELNHQMALKIRDLETENARLNRLVEFYKLQIAERKLTLLVGGLRK